MIYLASRLYLQLPSFEIDLLTDRWQDLAQDIELIGWSTWKIWQTIQVITQDTARTRIYSINGRSHILNRVGVARSCYLRLEPGDHRSTCTILSSDKEALESVRSLIENIYAKYAPVEPASLNAFIDQIQTLPIIQAARLYEEDKDCETVLTFGQPVVLSALLDRKPSPELLSVSMLVNIADPLLVKILYISKTEQQVGFSIETDLQEEDELIDKLFTLTDRTFKGIPIAG